MADVKYSGIGIVSMNGSIGATTFARNFYGDYAKTKKGAPASTPALVAWQTQVSSLVNVWTTMLTDADRASWYDVSYPLKDDFGDVHRLTGFALYMSLNNNMQLMTFTPFVTPPASSELIQIGLITLLTSTPGDIIILGSNPVSHYCAIYATPPLSAGRMSNNQIFAFIERAFIGSASPENIGALYTARFGGMPSGLKVFVKCVPISNNSGRRGNPKISSGIFP